MRISDWSSDVCSSDLTDKTHLRRAVRRTDAALVAGGRLHHGSLPVLAAAQGTGALQRRARHRCDERGDGAGGAAAALRTLLRRSGQDLSTAQLAGNQRRSEEHTSELQSLMSISY